MNLMLSSPSLNNEGGLIQLFGDVLPADAFIQVVTQHPLTAVTIVRILSSDDVLRLRLRRGLAADLAAYIGHGGAGVFILDTCALPLPAEQLCRFLRLRCAASRFLALLHPNRSSDEDMLRLLYSGVWGCICMTDRLEEQLPGAVRGLLEGSLWVPGSVLTKYVALTNTMIRWQTRPDPSLTARESQIAQLLLRRLSNKEISTVLKISERTVKFHLSNIFDKFGVEKRRSLIEFLTVAT